MPDPGKKSRSRPHRSDTAEECVQLPPGRLGTSPLTPGNTREVLMLCTKASGTIASRDTAISVLLAARLSNVPRCKQRDLSSAGAQVQQFGSEGHGEAQSSWGG